MKVGCRCCRSKLILAQVSMRISSGMAKSTERRVSAPAQAPRADSRYVVDIPAPRQRFFSCCELGVNREQRVEGVHVAAAAPAMRCGMVEEPVDCSFVARVLMKKLPRSPATGAWQFIAS